MSLKYTLIGSIAAAALSVPVFADQTDFSFPVHDILITSNVPTVNISVRNMSNSTDPEDRDLRVVSSTPVIPVTGQVWCKSYDHAETAALRAQIMFGNVNIVSEQGGAGPLMIGPFSASGFDTFNGTHELENFAIDAALEFPDSFDRHALVNLDPFNPVRVVENRMEQYVENDAGSEADFMRVDDVFETQVTLNAVGWCDYDSNNTNGEYAGARGVPVTVTIFYHGDADIQDVIHTVGGANTVAAQTPDRARRATTTRGSSATPPARNNRPARARSDDAQQRAFHGGVRVATGDVNGDGRKIADTKKQQTGRGRTQSRADVSPAQASSTGPGNDGLDTDSDGARAGLILPAVQNARKAGRRPQANAGVEPDEIDAPAQANTGVEPEEIDARATASDEPPAEQLSLNYTRVDAAARTAGVEPDEIDTHATSTGAAALLLPAVQQVHASQDETSTDTVTINYTGLENRNAGVEPEEIDARASAPQATALDALRIINHANEAGQPNSEGTGYRLRDLIVTSAQDD
ncbi:MAG: hypothetical protein DHS20C06_16940 [Hyphobacterium sp.]|nr:MAG: hypothetical protein DHS20C06_16940 [Hyphobacterium sp.]